MDSNPGVVVAGRYRILRKVGAGGMGEVWLGEHIAVGVQVALKTLLGAPGREHDVVARFKREAYLLGKVKSDHIARILDFVTDEKFGTVLVMEFVEGDSLAKVLKSRRLSVEETLDLGADIAAALVDLHQAKIVHRDLKPGNVILKPLGGDRTRAVLVDFGVSRMVSGGDVEGEEITGITKAGMTLGTLEYMSPEQILASRDATETADIYALGAILWRAVSGAHVFAGYSGVELAQQKIRVDPPELTLQSVDRISVNLCACIMRAIRRWPSERYQLAEEMLADLTKLRDLARLAALELDSATTIDAHDSVSAVGFANPPSSRRVAAFLASERSEKLVSFPVPEAMLANVPAATLASGSSGPASPLSAPVSGSSGPASPLSAPVSVSGGPVSVSGGPVSVSGGPPSFLTASASLPPEPRPPLRRGISRVVFGAALAASALVGAVVGGALWGRRHSDGARESAATAPSTAAPLTTIVVTPPSACESASRPTESATPPIVLPGGTASASPMDPEGLDPASRAALDGAMPMMDSGAAKLDAAVGTGSLPHRPALGVLPGCGGVMSARGSAAPPRSPVVAGAAVGAVGAARPTVAGLFGGGSGVGSSVRSTRPRRSRARAPFREPSRRIGWR